MNSKDQNIKVNDRHFEPYIPPEKIALRLQNMAEEIRQAYPKQLPVFVSVLNGAFMFTADLLRQFSGESEVHFVKITSYQGTQSSGDIQTLIGFPDIFTNRDVIILEDIIDTGLSMKYLIEQLSLKNPSSIKIATLLLKRSALKYPIEPDFIGFEIEHKFVVGYGLDYNGRGRNLPGIYAESTEK